MVKGLFLISLLCCISIQLNGCDKKTPIQVGFIGELTTRASGLGTSGRDGFLLAIEEANSKGGINGRLVEGKIRDVRIHKETALRAVRDLSAEKVSAIIGPMTSQTAVTIMPEINRLKIPLVSPTASTNQLSGLDDYFFRVYYSNAQAAKLLAKRLSTKPEGLHIAAIYDLGNKAYTQDWVEHFQEALTKNNNSSVSRIPFDLSSETLFLELASKALADNPDGILMLANAVDTAMICQQLTKLNSDLPRYATGWSYSDDLFHFGGKSVEGLTIIQSANMKDPAPSMQGFVENYRKRFRTEPNFPALHAYDATRMVLAALQKTTDPVQVREQLLQMGQFKGIHSNLALDRYGDLKEPQLYLARITNGKFVDVD